MFKEHLKKSFVHIDSMLIRNNIEKPDISTIILAGGCSSMPTVKQMISHYFEKIVMSEKDCRALVAMGALKYGLR